MTENEGSLPLRDPGASRRREIQDEWSKSPTSGVPRWPRSDPDEQRRATAAAEQLDRAAERIDRAADDVRICLHEQARRVVSGTQAAAAAPGLRVPVVLDVGEFSGERSWVAIRRLVGQHPEPDEPGAVELLGRVAARLHSVDAAALDAAALPAYRRPVGSLPTGASEAHGAARRLDVALRELGPIVQPYCGTEELVHGLLASSTVLLDGGAPPGVTTFEFCGSGCAGEDLGSLLVHETLLFHGDSRALLASYAAERTRLAPDAVLPSGPHVAFHMAAQAQLNLQWALRSDRELADDLAAAVPWLLAVLAGEEALC